MKDRVRLRLRPLGESLEVEPGTSLQDALFPYGVEFPCGGHGRCRGCRVKVLEGSLPISLAQERVLSPEELKEGWRLACCSIVEDELTLEVAQWETAILADSTDFEFTPREGIGIVVDLGTTTLVGQVLDLATGYVLGVTTSLNPQARYGSDVMSRIESAVARGAQPQLEDLIRREVGDLIRRLLQSAGVSEGGAGEIVIAGNTVMHHLFCGIDLSPLAHFPFQPVRFGLERFRARELGWDLEGDPEVCFLPCLGSFVGSDILAGILATRMQERERPAALLDLGTNGEVVVGNRERLVCTSTAAGPAFEGARISCGMRAATGAVARVHVDGGQLRYRVLGGGPPRGICGSGLVDAVAAGLDLGHILPSGRFRGTRTSWSLATAVELTQKDVRELQLAKAAIAAGLRILLDQWGATPEELESVYLAGAFGNYVRRRSARRIGLVDFPLQKLVPVGNTALLGAKIALVNKDRYDEVVEATRRRTQHVYLASDPRFQDTFVEEMTFRR